MKKILYLILLIIGGIIIGSLVAERAALSESMSWLAYAGGFEFPADKPLINLTIITITIGFSFRISIAQLIMILVAIFINYKTSPKLFP